MNVFKDEDSLDCQQTAGLGPVITISINQSYSLHFSIYNMNCHYIAIMIVTMVVVNITILISCYSFICIFGAPLGKRPSCYRSIATNTFKAEHYLCYYFNMKYDL